MQKQNYGGKLSTDGYNRAKKTITDSVQNESDINEKLKDYIEVPIKQIDYIPLNSHLRYLKYDPKTKVELFRFGGLLQRVYPEYIILKGKEGKTFCVQRYTILKNNKKIPTRFFKKSINNEKIKLEYEGYKKNASDIFEKQEDLIGEKNNIINDKELEIKILKNKLSKLMKN
jgi:hypothetical protein